MISLSHGARRFLTDAYYITEGADNDIPFQLSGFLYEIFATFYTFLMLAPGLHSAAICVIL